MVFSSRGPWSATLVAADGVRPPKDQYRLLQTAIRQSPTDKRLPAPFLQPAGRREVFAACSKYLSMTSWSQRRHRNPQKPLVIVSDNRTDYQRPPTIWRSQLVASGRKARCDWGITSCSFISFTHASPCIMRYYHFFDIDFFGKRRLWRRQYNISQNV